MGIAQKQGYPGLNPKENIPPLKGPTKRVPLFEPLYPTLARRTRDSSCRTVSQPGTVGSLHAAIFTRMALPKNISEYEPT